MKQISLKIMPRLLAVSACLMVTGAAAAESPTAAGPAVPGKTFIFHNAIRDLREFRAYAEIAASLRPYGNVEVDIGVLAERSPMHMPGFRSGWHDYGAYMATMWAFFPHPKLAPHLSANWVAANRELLLGKVAILKELGLGAVFSANEAHLLPESFFRQYSHLRGPRVDNPYRSTRAEFAWCVDQPETLEMIEWMMTELKRHAPQVQKLHSWYQDSGSGLCWLNSLYPGPNGPAHCRSIDPGVRVQGLMEAMDQGARKGGGSIQARMAGNFHKSDRTRIEPLLPAFAKFGRTFADAPDKSFMVIASRVTDAYPIRGIIDALAVLNGVNRLADPEVRVVDIDTCQYWYYRADEPIPTVRRLVDLVEDALKHPARGQPDATAKLRELAMRWGGEKNADRVMAGFGLIKQCFAPFDARVYFRDGVLIAGIYAYPATSRIVTRPLLIKPELLTPEEEAYFLPHVYAAVEDDARLDYKHAQGRRRAGLTEYRSPAYKNIHDSALQAANLFEQSADAPEGDWFRQLALSLRLWASTVRSLDNFYFGQEIRDRNPQKLAAPPRWIRVGQTSEPDLLLWNEIQRDEMDNANELRALLERGGLDLFAHAGDPRNEDCFLYGPDLVGALQKKADLMRTHWLDGQWYLAPLAPTGK